MKFLSLFIACSIYSLLFAQGKTDKEILTKIEHEWHYVYVTKNFSPLNYILADNFVHINGRGGKTNKPDEIKGSSSDQNIYTVCEPFDMVFDIYGGTAVVVGKTREKGTTPTGEPFEDTYFWTDVFVKKNSKWECVLAQTAPLPRPNFIFGEKLSISDSSIAQNLHRYVRGLAAKDSFSGVVLVGYQNKNIYEGAFGMASKEFNVPINFQTRFDLASLTKTFTGVAVSKLAEEGKINFTDPVSKYLPELPPNLTKGITIHHLLTHTSGLGSYWKPEFHEANHARFRTLKDYLKLIEKDTVLFKPGSQFGYSNSGYLILGLLIEKISGKSYFDYVKQEVFPKAQMKSSDFLESDFPNRNTASNYTKQNRYRSSDKIYSNTFFLGPVKGSSAGGAFSTAEDLLKFSNAIMNNSLLSQKNTQAMLEGKVSYDKPERRKKYSYGFAEQYVNNKRIVFHDGGANGISTQMDLYPDSGYTVVVLSNYDAPSAFLITNYLRNILTK